MKLLTPRRIKTRPARDSRINAHGVYVAGLRPWSPELPPNLRAAILVETVEIAPGRWTHGLRCALIGTSAGNGSYSYAPRKSNIESTSESAARLVAILAAIDWAESALKTTMDNQALARRVGRLIEILATVRDGLRTESAQPAGTLPAAHGPVPPGATATSTPAGIARLDPRAVPKIVVSPSAIAGEPDRSTSRNIGCQTLCRVSLDRLRRHPDNRHPTAAAVAALAASIDREGLLEPPVVRPDGQGGWQILSGETRVLALRQLGRSGEIDAHVIRCDDARALELLATYNAKRLDLNVIEKAQLIRRLCQPMAEGGAGYTREQAARLYGFESGAAASNLVRLLELPAAWQRRVASGELPQTFARLLLPYFQAPRLAAELEKSWHKNRGADRETWETRAGLEDHLDWLRDQHTRPVDGKTEYRLTYGQVGAWCSFPRLFELEPHRQRLQIITLEIDGKPAEVATNVKEFDRLNVPLVKAELAKKTKRQAEKGNRSKPARAEMTAAEKLAHRKEQEQHLRHRIAAWRHNWLKQLVTQALAERPQITLRVLVWLATNPIGWQLNQTSGDHIEQVLGSDPWQALAGQSQAQLLEMGRRLVAAVLSAADRNPRWPLLGFDKLNDLASMAGVDLETAWRQAQRAQDPLLAAFFELHQIDQLDALGAELGLKVDQLQGKAARVKVLMGTARALPLPKSIARLTAARKRKPK